MNWTTFWIFLTLYCLGQAVKLEENEGNEANEVAEIELKENAENVCIDQEVQNKILNITYIQSIVSILTLLL